jgi:hypothetical protein
LAGWRQHLSVQWDFVQTLDRFERFSIKHSYVKVKLVDDKANGPAVIAPMRKSKTRRKNIQYIVHEII